ncbi:TPA: HAMP domain-containing histidine kinase [Candidatus Woesearchaeota archaeon]|nr:HAMP domain-containing histidine kinase [Candidatus Woesearchaeota archaeon]
MQSQELTGLRRQAMIGSQATVLAHNIKNPLTGADGYVQLLEIMMSRVEDEKLRKMMQDYLKQVARSVDRAVGLARDIGHYARTGELNLDKRSLQAHYPLNKAMEAFYGRATKAGVEMVKEFEYTGFMRADMRIETVFENLVKNAMEAMPEGGTLTGRTARDGKYVVYVVEDTGKGIPEELQGKLFAEGATMGKDDGTGLGLYSANEIVKAHGGSVGYNSKPGRTAFIIKIPVISDAEPHDSGEYLQP